MKIWISALFLLIPVFLRAQNIITYAGNGTSVFSGDGHPATAAGIPDPCGGAFDKYGNYYFADLGAKKVRKIDTLGIITTIAGGGTGGDGGQATAAELNSPDAVQLDVYGNIFISDGGYNNVRKIDVASGIISTIAGNGTGAFSGDGGAATAAEIWGPEDICFDKDGNLYVADGYNYRVRKINTLGVISTFAGTGGMGWSGDGHPATDAEIDLPTGLVIDDTGNLYIAENLSNRVRKVDTFGIITTVVGNGSATYTGDDIPAINAQINPGKVGLDSVNNLYISDLYNNRVFKVDNAGIIHCVAGDGVAGFDGNGGPATAAELYTPTGIALDACGNLYIPEAGTVSIPDSGNNIRKVEFNPSCDPYHKTLGVNSAISKSAISIYPNPVYHNLTISSATVIHTVTISNLVGQILFSRSIDQKIADIDLSALPPGVYMVRVTDGDGNVVVRKVLKEQ